MVTIRHERLGDAPAREALLDLAFGPCRFTKTCQRLRDGRRPAQGLSFVATDFGRPVGTVRLWHIAAGGPPALLLGPLATHPDFRALGVGAALMKRALGEATHRDHSAVLLLGDAPYYARFGFSADKTGRLLMPGPYERDRLLARELLPGALDGARGMIMGAPGPELPGRTPRLAAGTAYAGRLARAA